jgi:hypothetical protein
MPTYPNYPGSRPGPHAATHGPGGSDPLNLAGMGAASTIDLDAEIARATAAEALKADKTTTITAGGLVTGGGDLSANRTLTVTKATSAEVITGTRDDVAVTPLGNKAALDAGVARTLEGVGLVFDGTAAASFTGSIIGTGDFTAFGFIKPIPGNTSVLLWGSANNSMGVTVRATTITLDQPGVGTPASVNYTATGEWIAVAVRRSGTSIGFFVNGVLIGTGTSSANFSIPTDYLSLANFTPFGIARTSLLNFALTDAEISDLFARLGIVPRAWWGGGVAVVNGAFANNGGAGGYETFSGASAAGFTGVNTDSTGGAFTTISTAFPVGKSFRVSGNLVVNSGQTPVLRLFRDSFAAQVSADVALTVGAFSVVVTTTAAAITDYNLQVYVTANSDFVLSGLSITTLGALYLQPDADQGCGPVLRAPTGSDTILPGDGHETGGVVRGNPAQAPYTLKFDVSGSGNRLVGGSDVRRIPTGWRITSIATDLSVSASLTLGTTSGAVDIVASIDPGTGIRTLTLAQPLPDPSRLWISGTITGNALITISPV